MLDKIANFRNELKLLSFAIGAIISYQRLSTSKIYNRRVHFFSTLYDTVATWFFLCISVHEITGNQLSIMTVLSILVTGCMLAGFLIYLSELRDIKVFLQISSSNDGDMMKIIKSSR
jgi:predicted Kef-type K+ transport protein